MRALPLPRALALTATALLIGSACSLMAPTDGELMGGVKQPAAPTAGTASSDGGQGSGGKASSTGSSGDAAGGELSSRGGDAGAPGQGGNDSAAELAPLIPRQGLALWLMADQGVVLGADGGVAAWSDFSVHEADARQSVAASQPALVPGPSANLPLLELDGAGDYLVLPGGFADFSAGLSAFIVASASSEQECPSLLQLSNESEQQDVEIGRFLGGVHYEVEDTEASADLAFGLQQLVLVGVVHAPEKPPELRLNGVLMGTGDFTALPVVKPRANNYIGRSLYPGCETFNGRIGEIILYSRALGAEDRAAVELYLQSKWSYVPPVKTKPGPGEIPAAK